MDMNYKYFLLGDTVPVRVAFNDKGMKMGAEVPDRDRGELVQDATYLSRLANSFEVEEINGETFAQKAQAIIDQGPEPDKSNILYKPNEVGTLYYQAGRRSIVLYRSNPSGWLVTANVECSGDLSIISGDSNREWHLMVAMQDTAGLRNALKLSVDASSNQEKNNDAILIALFEKFDRGNTNPFDEIENFLKFQCISYKKTSW